MALQKLLGSDKLVSKTGPVDTATLEGKNLMIYFSAHWCPPCRNFTPKLATFYKELKEKRDDFEIVFVSGDRSEEDFDAYYKESHPWLTLPWSAAKQRSALNKHFKVEGIPSLCVVDKDGQTVSKKGTEMVQRDPQGATFPWKPRTVYEVLAEAKITTKEGNPLTVDDLKKTDAFALYFSAHWCPPCRAFTPALAKLYNKLKAAGKKTEFVFVSSDREQDQYTEYAAEMPWAAMSFQDPKVQELKSLCEVSGIPTLATFSGKDGSIINNNARGAAGEDEEGADFPWVKKPLPPCSAFGPKDDVIDAVNGEKCTILATNDAANKDTSKIEFSKAAEKYHAAAKAKGEEPDVFFFVVDSAQGKDLYGRVLSAVGMPEPKEGTATVLSINFQNERAKSSLSGEISTQSVLAHVAAFNKSQDE